MTASSVGPRLESGSFTASRLDTPPVIDGQVSEGEWDRALMTSGLITPFDTLLQEADTTMSLGFDDERLYFLFRCKRGASEWHLAKKSRMNDEYDFGEPSLEIWITPPSDIPESFQNIINTYPAVFDLHLIPSRGYAAQGWTANWKIAENETDSEYIIEASIPIKSLGYDAIKDGSVWRFLLARTVPHGNPRPQASWSVTGAFAELPQHAPVKMMDDAAVVQLTGVSTVLSGKYRFNVAVVGARKKSTEAEVTVRFQKAVTPSHEDRVETRKLTVAKGGREETVFEGDVTDMKAGFFTVEAKEKNGTEIFRQNFPFNVSGWVASTPVRPANAAPIEQVAVTAQFGPETSTALVKADILELPQRGDVREATVKITDPTTGEELASGKLRPFAEWNGSAALHIPESAVPVNDFSKVADIQKQNHPIRERHKAAAKTNPPGKPEPLLDVPQTAPRKVEVVVTLKDAAGKEIRTARQELDLIRYAAEWMSNTVGQTDKVIPPYTPVEVQGPEVGVWNRKLTLDGLGLAKKVINGGVEQLAAPMRLVAVKDGKEIPIRPGDPALARHVENQADFTGSAEAAGLRIRAKTNVEFDGFVLNQFEITSADGQPVTVDRLFLEVELPAEQASHFCTTAGGWASVHDAIPDRWTSQQTGSGMLIGDFVPYIWITNSEKAFLWFADSDKGWNHDSDRALPTQELAKGKDKVTLRVNFFEVPTTVDSPRTITWGWQTFPARPLKPGWRATFCSSHPPTEHVTNTYFWTDADWAYLWPYYCSPFPWDYEKSRTMLEEASKNPLHRPMVGSIAHSIGRYQDYEWNQFPGLVVDWGATPGVADNANVTASRGPNDFRLWYYQRWVKESGFKGLYVDENYLALEDNYLTGNAYWRPDGKLQRAYNYLGLRDLYKRMKVMFHENGVPSPNLWQHISSGAAFHAWPGDLYFEGENVEPSNLEYDYLSVLPDGRLRAIGSSEASGGIMTMMLQSQRHGTQWSAKHNHQFVGWVMAHDILPEQSKLYPHLCEVGHLWQADVKFLPYWKPSPLATKAKDFLISAHRSPERTLVWVVNQGRQDGKAGVTVDWKTLGMDPAKTVAFNAETGESISLAGSGFEVEVLQRDFVPAVLVPAGTTVPAYKP